MHEGLLLIDERAGGAAYEPLAPDEPGGYSLLWVYGWDAEHNEPAGAHYVARYRTAAQGMAAYKVLADGGQAAQLMAGRAGWPMLMTPSGRPLLGPRGMRGVRYGEGE